ncbi:MAG TPA: Ig-like domain-containing protein [Steroidobacteraceae bacterium]
MTIRLRNLRTGWSTRKPLLDGGLDPVPVPAEVGDTLELFTTDSSGVSSRHLAAVTLGRPPVIVRTVPPPKKTDVPLNAIMVAIFSEPIDGQTLSHQTMQLLLGGQPVDGAVSLTPDGLIASFAPSSSLVAQTAYTLVVTTDVADPSGAHLEAAAVVPFVTAPATGFPQASRLPMISAGFSHTCAVAETGDAYCWGSNSFGELGIGHTSPFESSPQRVTGGLKFLSVSAGAGYTCGVVTGGDAYCWGENEFGELGTGDTSGRVVPTPVLGQFGIATLSAGMGTTCAITNGGHEYCWGNGSVGQLGRLDTQDNWFSTIPVLADTGPLISTSATGLVHTCALDGSSRVFCWGATTYHVAALARDVWIMASSASPQPLLEQLAFKSVATGLFHSCGIATSGAAYCWGTNSAGQLGNGLLGDSLTSTGLVPAPVVGGFTFDQIAPSEGEFSCGIVTGGAAYCWGINDWGQLGSPLTMEGCPAVPQDVVPYARSTIPGTAIPCSKVPVHAVASVTFASLSAGTVHACGISVTGLAYCWGGNADGQLGDGSTTSTAQPVLVPIVLSSLP